MSNVEYMMNVCFKTGTHFNQATASKTNIFASNGVIHLINTGTLYYSVIYMFVWLEIKPITLKLYIPLM